jgi:hypothetical protein
LGAGRVDATNLHKHGLKSTGQSHQYPFGVMHLRVAENPIMLKKKGIDTDIRIRRKVPQSNITDLRYRI